MRRFRRWRRSIVARRRLLALALVPFAATTTITITTGLASAGGAKRATLKAGTHRVRYGRSFRLTGDVPRAPHSRVVIDYRRLGGRHWAVRRHLTTGPHGGFATPIKARRSGVYRARSGVAVPSRPVTVAVRSRVKANAAWGGLAGKPVTVTGRVKPGVRGRHVSVRVGHDRIGTHTRRHGRFRVRWTGARPGRYPVHVVARGDKLASRNGSHAGRVTVFRQAVASWYGPGLYGHGVACGGTLEPGTLGVANKTLPCGARVTLRYHGHQVTVPVIDRGPYAAGRDYDLTVATKNRLHIRSGVATLLSSR